MAKETTRLPPRPCVLGVGRQPSCACLASTQPPPGGFPHLAQAAAPADSWKLLCPRSHRHGPQQLSALPDLLLLCILQRTTYIYLVPRLPASPLSNQLTNQPLRGQTAPESPPRANPCTTCEHPAPATQTRPAILCTCDAPMGLPISASFPAPTFQSLGQDLLLSQVSPPSCYNQLTHVPLLGTASTK